MDSDHIGVVHDTSMNWGPVSFVRFRSRAVAFELMPRIFPTDIRQAMERNKVDSCPGYFLEPSNVLLGI